MWTADTSIKLNEITIDLVDTGYVSWVQHGGFVWFLFGMPCRCWPGSPFCFQFCRISLWNKFASVPERFLWDFWSSWYNVVIDFSAAPLRSQSPVQPHHQRRSGGDWSGIVLIVQETSLRQTHGLRAGWSFDVSTILDVIAQIQTNQACFPIQS